MGNFPVSSHTARVHVHVQLVTSSSSNILKNLRCTLSSSSLYLPSAKCHWHIPELVIQINQTVGDNIRCDFASQRAISNTHKTNFVSCIVGHLSEKHFHN